MEFYNPSLFLTAMMATGLIFSGCATLPSADELEGLLFRSTKAPGFKAPGNITPHDARGGETVDEATGIAIEAGQIVNNTTIDPEIQDEAADQFHLRK
jgi:hypothetical protein